MSKGWESKSVEEQQAQAATDSAARTSAATAARTEADRQRRIQALEMQRERVLSEQTSSEHRRGALQAALATLERELQELGWMVKL
jgi:hypothetical protein